MSRREIRIKRAYDSPEADDGVRVLVDRVWPRGKSKEQLRIDHWAKALAPSAELRQWFNHEPEKWADFKQQYVEQLKQHKDQVRALLDEAGDRPLTLVYAARDERHNNGVVLREYLRRLRR